MVSLKRIAIVRYISCHSPGKGEGGRREGR
jgi:hypothetical protein